MDLRRACAVMSGLIAAFMLASQLADQPLGILIGWVCTLPLLLVTSRALNGPKHERLAWPLAYRAAAAAVFALAVAGALLATVPGSSTLSSIFAVYFVVVALAGYHALVARGPGDALLVAVAAQLLAIPFAFLGALASIGCKCGRHREPPWTDRATMLAWLGSELLAIALLAVAPVAFRPREDGVPEARVIR